MDELMSVTVDLDSEPAKLREEAFDLFLFWIASHIAQVFILGSRQDLMYDTCKPVGDSDLSLVFGSQPEGELVIFGAIK